MLNEEYVGWLSPTGEHYACEGGCHVALVEKLGMTERQAENRGWVRIIDGGWRDAIACYTVAFLTTAQKEFLENRNIDYRRM